MFCNQPRFPKNNDPSRRLLFKITRDPATPSENGFMEPKYYMRFGGDWTPQNIIL